ncbi:MAG: hypothetical protein ABI583_11780 [Betaproteobacteria bacterium]
MSDPSMRLRPLVSLLLFLSAYSPLMIILVIKDFDASSPWLFHAPTFSAILFFVAVASSVITLRAVNEVGNGLPVVVSKAANKSGDMFGYTIPYMLSFMRFDLADWQTLLSLLIFFAVLFVMAYRTQTVFINPILAIAGYMLIDCTFKRDETEIQAMVISRDPIAIGDTCRLERLSHYLYIAAQPSPKITGVHDEH